MNVGKKKLEIFCFSPFFVILGKKERFVRDECGGESLKKGNPFFSGLCSWGGVVPIIEISVLGKHGPLRPGQKHTLRRSSDKPPLSRRHYVHVSWKRCVCVP